VIGMPEQRAIIGTVTPYLQALREHVVFGELPDQALKDLVIRSDLIVFRAGETMLRQGDPSDAALLIMQGEVEIVVEGAHEPFHLGRLSGGALIGEIGVFARVPRTATVVARSDVEALRIGGADMLQIGGDHNAFLRAVMGELGKRIAAFNQAIGFYTTALTRLEQSSDPHSLEAQPPLPELVDFAHTLRRIARRIGRRRADASEDTSA
jgi:phosphoserine phosphatase RsbU/P